MRKGSRIILALDEVREERALWVADQVADLVDAIKINWPLVLSTSPETITRLSQKAPVICDFKVADIPNTASLIVSQAVKRGAEGVIVHGFTGSDSVKAAVQAADGRQIFVVTEMSHPGGAEFTAPAAESLARMAVECGASGIIAPATRPERVAALRKIVGDLLILSPGVGAQGGSASATISKGADYVIVGRSIYGAENPREAALQVAGEIKKVLRR
ncbi:MAG: orotidine-5'-phosphate decarboxylase [Methanomassiliicoccales archaeon]|nr:orotidine-5'-phosphate decarboxylase [Methanomassiliicoccales archaeon]